MDNSTSTGERATLQGAFVQDARDALLVIVAVHAGLVPPVPRRLSYASQRTLIRPGAVFVWRTGDIARWTDNCQWTASHSVQPKLLVRPVATFNLLPADSRRVHRCITSDLMCPDLIGCVTVRVRRG
jgi:hypothetical protein